MPLNERDSELLMIITPDLHRNPTLVMDLLPRLNQVLGQSDIETLENRARKDSYEWAANELLECYKKRAKDLNPMVEALRAIPNMDELVDKIVTAWLSVGDSPNTPKPGLLYCLVLRNERISEMGKGISALFEHKFDLSKMKSFGQREFGQGPMMSVVHNNVNLSFQLSICCNVNNCSSLSIYYCDGPNILLKLGLALFLAKGPVWEPVCVVNNRVANVVSWKQGYRGINFLLPGTLEGLRADGYLSQDDMLHAFAIVFIAEDAFKDPKTLYPLSSVQNRFRYDLYLQTETPTATNSPCSNRLEMISNDGHRFWVHRDVLAFNSHVFKQMFDDPEKLNYARLNNLREGRLTVENASGGAVKEMLSYLYLQQTTPEFDKFAMELVPVAEMYGLKGLTLLCCQTLLVQCSENLTDVGKLLRLLEFAQLHKLTHVEEISAKGIEEVVQERNDVDRKLLLKVTENAHKHGYDQLKTVCQQKLVHYANECGNLDIEELLHYLQFSHLHKLAQLEEKSVKRLEEVVQELNDVDRRLGLLLRVTEQAHKHGYDQLKRVCQRKLVQHVNQHQNLTVACVKHLGTESRNLVLDGLGFACGVWLSKNCDKVAEAENGHSVT